MYLNLLHSQRSLTVKTALGCELRAAQEGTRIDNEEPSWTSIKALVAFSPKQDPSSALDLSFCMMSRLGSGGLVSVGTELTGQCP